MNPGPYYIMPSERLQELLDRARAGEDVGSLMAEEYAAGESQQVAAAEADLTADLHAALINALNQTAKEQEGWLQAIWMAFLADEETHELTGVLQRLSAWMMEQQQEAEAS